MSQITDVVIIGSGALGCAAAYCLIQSGARRVTVVDRGPLVSGMTRRNAGLLYAAGTNPVLLRLADQSRESYRRWAAEVGGSCGFRETGSIVTAQSDEGARLLEERVKQQERLGISARLIDQQEFRALAPRGSWQDIVCAAYEPNGGYVDPLLATQAWANRARERGARFETGTLVKLISQERGRVLGVTTTIGAIQSTAVVIAAGAGADRLLAPLGLTLNLQSVRGAIGFFEQPQALYEEGHPIFVDVETGDFVRPHAFHLSAVGITAPHKRLRPEDGLDEEVSRTEAATLGALAARRVPLLQTAPMRRSHAILYDCLADGKPALGAVPRFDGLYVMAGFGCSAVAVAPAVGRIMSEIVVDGRAALNVDDFSPARPALSGGASRE